MDAVNMNDVEVVGICVMLDKEVGRDAWLDMSYEETTAVLDGWLREHDAHYYGAPRENFSEWEARRQAANLGKSIVVVEDLS